GARSNRDTMPLPAVCPGRPLERRGDTAPRGMTVLDRTRLTGRLRFSRAARGKSVRRFAPGAKHRAASRPGRRSNFHTPLTPPAFAAPDSGALVVGVACRFAVPLRDPVGEATSTPRSRLRRSLSLTQGLFRVRLWIA